MLEIIIIFCLAAALFLLLRHYPDAKEFKFPINKEKFQAFLKRIKKPGNKKLQEDAITFEINRGQENVVSPREIEEISSNYGEDPEIAELLFQAEKAFMENDLRVAEDKSLEAIGKNKRSAKAYLIIGNVALSRGQFSEAKEAYKTAKKCNPELGEIYFGLGQIDLRNENFAEATENLQKCIALEKGHADWYAELGKAYMEVRQYAKAAKVLKRATSLDIDNKEYRDLATQAEEKHKTHSLYSRQR